MMTIVVIGGRFRRMFRERKESFFVLKGHQCHDALCLTAKVLRSISEGLKKEAEQAAPKMAMEKILDASKT